MVRGMSNQTQSSVTLTVSNLSARRGGRTIFEGLSFELQNGQSMAVVGPNGSGKSTLLRVLAGLLRSETGTVQINSYNTQEICFSGHRDGLKGALTVHENLTFWANLYSAAENAVETAISLMALEAVLDMPADMLSAGWRRRAGLARLALGTASIWMLDEPYTALDTENITRIDNLLSAHVENGGIALLATHKAPGFTPTQRIDMTNYRAKAPEGPEIDW